jgi:hypothetical protein
MGMVAAPIVNGANFGSVASTYRRHARSSTLMLTATALVRYTTSTIASRQRFERVTLDSHSGSRRPFRFAVGAPLRITGRQDLVDHARAGEIDY